MFRRTLIPLILAASLAVPAAAMAKSSSGSGGGVTATFSYQGTYPQFTDQTLTITKGGTTLYKAAVTDKACGKYCGPGALNGGPSVRVLDLDATGSPDVVLSLYTGGAHCCSVVQVFRASAALGGKYVRSAEHDFGDPGYLVKNIGPGGSPEFLTGDDRFAYAFTDYAASGLPIQILQLKGVKFVDVTDAHRSLIVADAKRWLTAYKKQARSGYTDSVGVIAAWAADEARLGKWPAALTYIKTQETLGHLNSAEAASLGGEHFVTSLVKALKKDGYIS